MAISRGAQDESCLISCSYFLTNTRFKCGSRFDWERRLPLARRSLGEEASR
jgi:hypothetical protein